MIIKTSFKLTFSHRPKVSYILSKTDYGCSQHLCLVRVEEQEETQVNKKKTHYWISTSRESYA